MLDPFSGSGVTACEALKLKRKATWMGSWVPPAHM
ncbi:MAG: hypothetical protein ACE5MK_11960 [Acidobacteriota bacterium]